MKQNSLDKYLFKKNIETTKKVELELSDSQGHNSGDENAKKKQRVKLFDLFNNRIKNKPNPPLADLSPTYSRPTYFQPKRQPKFVRPSMWENVESKKYPEPEDDIAVPYQDQVRLSATKLQQQRRNQIYEQVKIYEAYSPINYKNSFLQNRNRQIQEQKRLKRLQKKQQQKKKLQEQTKKKSETFKKFLGNIGKTQKALPPKNEEGELNNIALFNKMQEQNLEKIQDKKQLNPKTNTGLIYQKITMEKQKVPISFLKLLLSYKFSAEILAPENKKVPNYFEDQMTYKKVFHYLVVNECIADLHMRLKKIQQGQTSSIPITISNFKSNSNGFIQFSMKQQVKENPASNQKQKKEKFVLKNFSLSRNRLGLVTNAKNFKTDHYGIPSKNNERIFAFLCLLVTPESKEDLNSETKGLCNIQVDSLDIILKLNKTSKCYFYDLEKISTHLREYQAITHLHFTEVASFIYNPKLIEERHLEMIGEEERQMLEPILHKIKQEYNPTQYESIRQMALREVGVVLLQGPPGTGKTTTLMGLLAVEYEYLKNVCSLDDKRKILICAPSNAAIDHITKRLVCEGLITTNQGNFSKCTANEDYQNASYERVFPKILRVGIVETDDPDIIGVSLDDICDKHLAKATQNINQLNNMTTTQIKQKMISLSKQIHKVKARKDLQEWEKEKKTMALKFEIKGYENMLFVSRKERIERKQIYTQIENKLFDEADIILTTLSSSGSQKMERLRGFIGCLIIDQAAQATEPTILIPLQTGVRKVLLIGDPCQLPATTMSQDSSLTLFNRSLFERFLDNDVRPYFLNMQYRMAPLIREFPSKMFYNNRLVDAESVKQRYLTSKNENKQADLLQPISQFFNRNSLFIDVKFAEEEFHANSYRNIGQCLVLKNLILDFIKKTKLSIGVITPYQAQKKYLLRELKNQIETVDGLVQELQNFSKAQKHKSEHFQQLNDQNSGILADNLDCLENGQQKQNNERVTGRENGEVKKKSSEELLHQRIMINTVDSFQGQQKDIIIVSTVRANSRKDIGFMKDQRRINVALTRGRHLLIVVGNGNTMGSNQIWHRYLEWAEHQKCYYQIRSRQSIQSVIYKANLNFSQEAVERIRHQKLSRDLRKLDRTQIKKEDFGMKPSKKVKRQRSESSNRDKHQEQMKKDNAAASMEQKIKEVVEQDEKKAEELLEQKRAREQEARTLEEVNKRLKQLQQRMKMDENNPYAGLFAE